MVKTVTSIFIEADLIRKAKLHGLVMSDFVANKLDEYFLQQGIAANITDQHRKELLLSEVKIYYDDAGDEWEKFIAGRCRRINKKFALDITPEILRREMLEFLKLKGGEKNEGIPQE